MKLLRTSLGDWIQFGILLTSGLGLLGGFWAYCEGHFATTSSVLSLDDSLKSEVEERRELKSEIDQIYVHMIPASARMQIKYGKNRNTK